MADNPPSIKDTQEPEEQEFEYLNDSAIHPIGFYIIEIIVEIHLVGTVLRFLSDKNRLSVKERSSTSEGNILILLETQSIEHFSEMDSLCDELSGILIEKGSQAAELHITPKSSKDILEP